MALSDCPRCWKTPCACGHEYKHWSIDRLTEFHELIGRVIEGRKQEEESKAPITEKRIGLMVDIKAVLKSYAAFREEIDILDKSENCSDYVTPTHLAYFQEMARRLIDTMTTLDETILPNQEMWHRLRKFQAIFNESWQLATVISPNNAEQASTDKPLPITPDRVYTEMDYCIAYLEETLWWMQYRGPDGAFKPE